MYLCDSFYDDWWYSLLTEINLEINVYLYFDEFAVTVAKFLFRLIT